MIETVHVPAPTILMLPLEITQIFFCLVGTDIVNFAPTGGLTLASESTPIAEIIFPTFVDTVFTAVAGFVVALLPALALVLGVLPPPGTLDVLDPLLSLGVATVVGTDAGTTAIRSVARP